MRRFRRPRLGLLCLIVVVLVGFAPQVASAQTTGLASVAWQTPLDTANVATFYTHPSGAVSVAQKMAVRSFGAGQEQLGSFSLSGYHGSPAIGKDGTLYLASAGKITALMANSTSKWSADLPTTCGVSNNASSIQVGSDGEIYALVAPSAANACAGSLQLTKFAANTGAVSFVKPIGDDSSSALLSVYTNGLAVIRGTTVRFVGYDGSDQGQFTGPDAYFGVSPQISADGTAIFLLSHLANSADGCPTSGIVLDGVLLRNVAGAQAQAALHDCVSSASIQPLSTGGVLLNELNPDSSVTLVAIGSDGSVKWRKTLPNQSGAKTFVGYAVAISDSNANVVVARGTYVDDRYGVDIEVLGAGNGARQSIFTTDTLDANASFAWLTNGYASSIGLATNRLYIALYKCVNGASCASSLYAIGLNGLAMDYPRGTVLGGKPQNPPEALKLVAWLGDSFSSGEGAGDYFPGTNVPANKDNFNMCHRSKNAYSQLLTSDPSLKLKNGGFFACSGATTSHIVDLDQYGTQPPQTLLLTKKADLVVLTIGGNDVGFGEFATACALPLTTCVGKSYERIVKKINSNLAASLTKALKAIGRKMNPAGEILVVGYPMIVPAPRSVLQECGQLNSAEMILARDAIGRISTTQSEAIAQLNTKNGGGGPKITFLDMAGESLFKGHELCTEQSAFNPVKLNGKAESIFVESFHPNKRGQGLYAQAIKTYLLSR